MEKATASRQGAAKDSAPTSLGRALAPQLTANPILRLQRSIGNQAVRRLFRNDVLQAKLASNPPGDPYEQEADRAAEQVVGTTGTAIIQRKCACGGAPGVSGECEECSKQKRLGFQTELKVNEPGDIYEQEADRIADQVLATPAHSRVSGAPLHIQHLAGPPTGRLDAAPSSVDQTLASPGTPLEPSLRQDMEQRFGHDFSRVRVHSGATADRSARDVNAHAYTVGHNIVFGPGQFAPTTYQGRRLVSHELTHVVQQSIEDGFLGRQPQKISSTPRVTAMLQRQPADPSAELAQSRRALEDAKRVAADLVEEVRGKPINVGPSWARKARANRRRSQKILAELEKISNDPAIPNAEREKAIRLHDEIVDLNEEARIAQIARDRATGAPKAAEGARAKFEPPQTKQRGELPSAGAKTEISEIPKTTPAPGEITPETPISPAVPSSAAEGQAATAGAVGGAGAMIHQGQVEYLQNAEQDKADEALRRIQPEIDRLVARGRWVAVRFHFDAPKAPSITAGVFREQSDINRFVMITYKAGDTKEEALGKEPTKISAVVGPPETYEAPKRPLGADRTTFIADTKLYPPQYNPKAIKGPYDIFDLYEFTGFKTYVDSKNIRSLYIRWEGKNPILSIVNLKTLQPEYYVWGAWLDLGKQRIYAFYNNYLTGEFFQTEFLITPENLLEYGKRLGPGGGVKQEVVVWRKTQ